MALDNHSERHIKLEDNDGDKNLSKLWFHKECFKEMMTGKERFGQLQEQAQQILNFAKDKMGMEEVKV